jgi:hypothetical protein
MDTRALEQSVKIKKTVIDEGEATLHGKISADHSKNPTLSLSAVEQ